MSVMNSFLLYVHTESTLTITLLWGFGVLLLLFLIISVIWQRRTGKRLRGELEELDKIRKGNLENDFVLKAMKVAIWRFDIETMSFYYEKDNREGIHNYTPAPGETFSDSLNAISPADVDHVNRAFMDICEGRTDFYHQEYQVVSKTTGTSYWEESYATIVDRKPDGTPTKIVGTSQRIDERKELEASLVAARNKAEESDRLKTAFLANMGQEIRTPLNAIVGFADLLPVVQSEEDRNQLIQEIQVNNQKLLRIINGLVSMSEIEAGAHSLMKDAVDLSALFQETVSQHQPTTNLPIELYLPDTPLQIHTDHEVLKEIIDNLLQNAIKFTVEGTISLGYNIEGDQVRLWVQDTGKGIAKEDQERIFERFVKVDEFIPGTGLGLSVVKSHVTNLGGSVGVESAIGQGSMFWVLLPIT